jgi:hypothetical protein
MGRTPAGYLRQIIAATLAGNEKSTVVSRGGRNRHGMEFAYNRNGVSQDL